MDFKIIAHFNPNFTILKPHSILGKSGEAKNTTTSKDKNAFPRNCNNFTNRTTSVNETNLKKQRTQRTKGYLNYFTFSFPKMLGNLTASQITGAQK